MASSRNVEDLAAMYAAGEIDLTELNHRAAEAGEAATSGDDTLGPLTAVTSNPKK